MSTLNSISSTSNCYMSFTSSSSSSNSYTPNSNESSTPLPEPNLLNSNSLNNPQHQELVRDVSEETNREVDIPTGHLIIPPELELPLNRTENPIVRLARDRFNQLEVIGRLYYIEQQLQEFNRDQIRESLVYLQNRISFIRELQQNRQIQ